MGVLPLQFKPGESAASLGLTGYEEFSITGVEEATTHKIMQVTATKEGKQDINFEVVARLDSPVEVEYYKHGGILQYVLRQFLK